MKAGSAARMDAKSCTWCMRWALTWCGYVWQYNLPLLSCCMASANNGVAHCCTTTVTIHTRYATISIAFGSGGMIENKCAGPNWQDVHSVTLLLNASAWTRESYLWAFTRKYYLNLSDFISTKVQHKHRTWKTYLPGAWCCTWYCTVPSAGESSFSIAVHYIEISELAHHDKLPTVG